MECNRIYYPKRINNNEYSVQFVIISRRDYVLYLTRNDNWLDIYTHATNIISNISKLVYIVIQITQFPSISTVINY